MRKFAAHYLLTDTGQLLKNGIAVAKDNGTIQFIDTKGQLEESERMIFYSGLLLGAFEYRKMPISTLPVLQKEKIQALFCQLAGKDFLTLNEVIDLAKQFQYQYPEIDAVQVFQQIEQVLQFNSFEKITIPGLYLLSGLDLGLLHFTDKTRLKKIV